jgi:ABC-type glycerol-3-phosphate transport system substrate-binding protein
MKRLNRRDVLKGLSVLGVSALGGTLAACGASTAQVADTQTEPTAAAEAPTAVEAANTQAASTEPQEIEWWFGWAGCGLEDIAAKFETENPDIKVKYVDQGYGYGGKLMAAIASGNPPGLAFNVFYNELIARDLCIAMDDYIAAAPDANLTTGDIPAALMDRWKWQGKQYGIPACDTSTRYGMSYNTNLLQDAGFTAPDDPQTWDEVFEWHKAITKMDDAGNLKILGAAPSADCSASAHGIDPWVYPEMWGFHYFDDKEMKFTIDRPETVEILSMIKKFWDVADAKKVSALNDSNQDQWYGPYSVGLEAMYIIYPSGPAGLYNHNPEFEHKQTWVPVPSGRKGKKITTVGGHASTILKDSKFPEATFKLAVYITEADACNILFDKVGWVGPRKSYQDTVKLDKYPQNVQDGIWFFVRRALDEADEIYFENDPIGSITDAEWIKARDGVVYGDMTPEEAAKKMEAKLNDELAKMQDQG